ncbi:MAG: hypothetical protein Q9N34_04415 [Aquificota bacterium]|nr:hypothetical protein [Aquificota bacterium]
MPGETGNHSTHTPRQKPPTAGFRYSGILRVCDLLSTFCGCS